MEKQFLDYLEKTSLMKKDKSHIGAIFDYFKGKNPQIFSNRSFLFEGEPGVGKTFLAKKLINALNIPTIYLGQSIMGGDNVITVSSIDNLLKELKNFSEGIVYLDDLKFIFDFNEDGWELDNKHRKKLMKVLESFRDNDAKTVLMITLNDSDFFEESLKDRIDVKISFNLPSEDDKINFLKNTFKKHIGSPQLEYLARNSIGYNYRDLPNVIKLAYFHGDKIINKDSIIDALKQYQPSSLSRFNVKQGINLGLKDLFLEEKTEKDLRKVMTTILKNKELQESGVLKHNFFIFEGPAGVGKTHSVTAIAGELGIPLLKAGQKEVYHPRYGLENLFFNVKRFGKAIVLIDDADKVFQGGAMDFDDGGALFSDLNHHLDELEEKGAILIFSANDSKRFGKALRDRFKIIKFDYPTINQRRLFFRSLIKKSKIKLNFNENLFALSTEGNNFRDMQRSWNDLMFYAIDNNKKSLNEFDFQSLFNFKSNNRKEVSMIG